MSHEYELRAAGHSHRDLEAAMADIFETATSGALASVAAGVGAPHVGPVMVARDQGFDLVLAADEGAQIARNLAADDRVALTIWNPAAEAQGQRNAIQIFGVARTLDGAEADRALDLLQAQHGPQTRALRRNAAPGLFRLRVASARLINEERFAPGYAVALYVDRGRQWSAALAEAST